MKDARRIRGKRLWGLLLLTAVLLGFGSCAQSAAIRKSPLIDAEDPQNENMADLLQKSSSGMMVQIAAGDLSGSGVLWDVREGELLILTAGHVLAQAGDEIRVTFAGGFQTAARKILTEEKLDLAYLGVELKEIPGDCLEMLCLVHLGNEEEALKQGEGMIVMASVSGVAKEAYEGIVLDPWIYAEDLKEYIMLAQVETKPGMSGGGVFDYSGYFQGILCGQTGDGEAVVVPVSVIRPFYSKLLESQY